jgi:hypothetical protein
MQNNIRTANCRAALDNVVHYRQCFKYISERNVMVVLQYSVPYTKICMNSL